MVQSRFHTPPLLLEQGSQDQPVVVVVDDEPAVCHSLVDLLRRQYHVFATTSPEYALPLLEQGSVALLITDQRMPGMSGADLLALSRRVAPSTPRILLSAYGDIEAVIRSVNEGGLDHYVSKPWEPDELLALVSHATAGFGLASEHARLLREVGAVMDDGYQAAAMGELRTRNDDLARDNATLRQALDNLRDMFWHLRKIQEMVPLCIQCRRVKVNGRGWIDPDLFLQSDTGFIPHGYCEECASGDLHLRPWHM